MQISSPICRLSFLFLCKLFYRIEENSYIKLTFLIKIPIYVILNRKYDPTVEPYALFSTYPSFINIDCFLTPNILHVQYDKDNFTFIIAKLLNICCKINKCLNYIHLFFPCIEKFLKLLHILREKKLSLPNVCINTVIFLNLILKTFHLQIKYDTYELSSLIYIQTNLSVVT